MVSLTLLRLGSPTFLAIDLFDLSGRPPVDRLARTRIVTRLIATIALLFGLLLAPAAVAAPAP